MSAVASSNSPPPPIPPVAVRWSGLTHVGRVRPNNEDAFLALSVDGREVRFQGKTGHATLEEADFVFAVSDGMGGAKAGEFASRIAVDRITSLLPRAFPLSAAGNDTGFKDIMDELFSSIHADLLKLGFSYEECAGMGTTLSLCWFTRERMYFGHVGDSRIYHLPRAGTLAQITHDHSHVGWLRRQGRISEREARSHPRRNALQQVLGANQQFIDPQVGAVHHQPGDRFLICSDGIVDGLWDRKIEELMRTSPSGEAPLNFAQLLVEAAVENSGRDNTTALVIELLPRPALDGRFARQRRAPDTMPLIFVYGTLKRGGSNHRQLAGQTFLDEARTEPGYRLFALGDFPGMVACPADRDGVTGEVWSVDDACVQRLDEFEGASEGIFCRHPVALLPPFADRAIEAYFYLRSVAGCVELGSTWSG